MSLEKWGLTKTYMYVIDVVGICNQNHPLKLIANIFDVKKISW